jgi:hypothetical protein
VTITKPAAITALEARGDAVTSFNRIISTQLSKRLSVPSNLYPQFEDTSHCWRGLRLLSSPKHHAQLVLQSLCVLLWRRFDELLHMPFDLINR